MPASHNRALADNLIRTISDTAKMITDDRPNKVQGKISLHDVLMSAFAMMHLKFPSLLEFDEKRLDPEIENNLKTLYRVNKAPSDTHMRKVLDPVSTQELRHLFKAMFTYVQRSGWLRHFKYFEEGYLATIDGTGYFASGKLHCTECCVKQPNSSTPQYYHQLLGVCLVKPGRKEVLPFMPEPIIQQTDTSKNDCEVNALRRLLERINSDNPRLNLVLNLDGLYSKGPTIKLVRSYNHHYIMVARDGDHVSLLDTVDEQDKQGNVTRHEYIDDKGHRHWFRFINDVPLNKTHPDVKVNYLEYVEYDQKGKRRYSNIWITSLDIHRDSCMKIMRGGRARWKIENETFNTLKTQGYHLEHNYGHGEEHLSSNLACLMFLAFLVDQIDQLACPLFGKALESCRSKIKLWEIIRNQFTLFIIDSWCQFLKVIAYQNSKVPNRRVTHITTLIDDTS